MTGHIGSPGDELYPWQPGYVIPPRPAEGDEEDELDLWPLALWAVEDDDWPLLRPLPRGGRSASEVLHRRRALR